MRILENADCNIVYSILFELLTINRRNEAYTKTMGLIVKCILKLTKSVENFLSELKIEDLLLRFHFYLLEFGKDSYSFGDDIGIKAIKTILNELIKNVGEKIWFFYSAIRNHNEKDHFLKKLNIFNFLDLTFFLRKINMKIIKENYCLN